ncbi:putative START-like domain superfamily protein [Plasmopara halstedii]
MNDQRFLINPFGQLNLSREACNKLVEITDEIIMAKFEEYEEHLNINKQVDLKRWKKFSKSGPTTAYLERKNQNPDTKLPQLLMVGPLPGTLDENMFGLVNPTIESMRIKSSYLNDFNAAAVLATIIEPTVNDPFRAVVIKWMEIDIPLASIGIVRNRDYVYIESTGLLHLQNGERVGYHLLHSVTFPEVHELPNRVRGNMSFCGIFHQEGPDRTDCRGTGIMNPGGDMIRAMAVMGMVQATMAGVKYSYCGQMKKLAYLLEQRQDEARDAGTRAFKPICITCKKSVSTSKLVTCKLCFGAVCSSCRMSKKLSFIAPDLTLLRRKVPFCVKCLVEATQMDTQEVAREQLEKRDVSLALYGMSAASDLSTCSESTLTF